MVLLMFPQVNTFIPHTPVAIYRSIIYIIFRTTQQAVGTIKSAPHPQLIPRKFHNKMSNLGDKNHHPNTNYSNCKQDFTTLTKENPIIPPEHEAVNWPKSKGEERLADQLPASGGNSYQP